MQELNMLSLLWIMIPVETDKGTFFKMYDKTLKLLKEKQNERKGKVSERKNSRKKH